MKRAGPVLLAVFVAAFSLGITAWLWQHDRDADEAGLRASFDAGLRQTAGRIEQRIASYDQMLRGVQGLFMASGVVDRASFDTYVDALLAGSDFSGLQSITYGPLVSAAGLALHVARQRAGGEPDYDVTPPGDRPAYAPVTYIAPDSGGASRVLGYDLYTEPTRRVALEQARDSGASVITGRLRLVTETQPGTQYAFLMILPLYAKDAAIDNVAARRAALTGWVWAAFKVDELMSSLYGESLPGLEVRLYDGVRTDADALIYGDPHVAGAPAESRFSAQEYIAIGGHSWTLAVRSTPGFEQRFSRSSAHVIAVAGISLSLLLALLAWQLATARARAYGVARAMTQELRSSEERYRRIVETANEGIWLVDVAGHISFANPKLLEMLGRASGDVLGRPLAEFLGEGGRLHRDDGSDLWVAVSSAPIADADGAPTGVLGMATDITERRQSRAKRETLEAQLRESQKMEAIGTLAGGIAHDFNNILAAILGNVALTRQHLGRDAAAAGTLDQIERAGVRARSLVQKILAFSRMQPHAPVTQALRPLVEDAMPMLRSTLPTQVELRTVLAADTLLVDADAIHVEQILMNLCTNAWHAMQGRAGRITIGLERVDLSADAAKAIGELQPGGHAHLWVADTGTGMPEATRARVFEPFFTTKPVGAGTGLGLSVVHGIVVAHHGAIVVESYLGRGTTFDLYFPLRTGEPTAVAEVPSAVVAPRGTGQHVVVVDDDPAMLLMVDRLLQNAGYRVSTYERPLEALDAILATPGDVDLVVSDHNMPGMTGLDLAERLAQRLPGLPVLISSGYLTDEMRLAASRLGVRGLMQKEYSLEQLAARVGEVFRLPPVP